MIDTYPRNISILAGFFMSMMDYLTARMRQKAGFRQQRWTILLFNLINKLFMRKLIASLLYVFGILCFCCVDWSIGPIFVGLASIVVGSLIDEPAKVGSVCDPYDINHRD